MYATKLFIDNLCLCADADNSKLVVINGMGQSHETHPWAVESPAEFLARYNELFEVEMTESDVFAADFLDQDGIPTSFEDCEKWEWNPQKARYVRESQEDNE